MKNYQKQTYKNREEWLSARGIGGSEAAAIVGESKWLTADDIYNRLVYGKEPNIEENEKMLQGIAAEPHIRALWAIDHQDCEVVEPPKRGAWLFRRKDYPLLTCTPDGLFKKNGELYGLEIKNVDLISGSIKDIWENGILPPQYYYQVLHYMVVINDLKGVCLTAHLRYYKKEDDKWAFDYAKDVSFWIYRDIALEQINYLEQHEIDFITNNVNKKRRPKLLIRL